jgi:hypothetical protein
VGTRLRCTLACLGLGALAAMPVQGADIAALIGPNEADDPISHSYAWQVEFNEVVSMHWAASLAWINEGHLDEDQHARDGPAAQLWLTGPQWRDRLWLAAGVGPYAYFDTEPSATSRGYSDTHGIGGIGSLAAWLRLYGPLFLDFRINQIVARDISTRAVMLGFSYHFGNFRLLGGSDGQDDEPDASAGGVRHEAQELQVFGGKNIVDSLTSGESKTFGVDYHLRLARWAAWSATWFNDPDVISGSHDRLASQFWLVEKLDGHLLLSAGLGGYGTVGARPSGSDGSRFAGVWGMRAEWEWGPRLSVIATMNRTFTEDDRDRDLITLGLGWRFGGS